ncbi:hypothetical protein BBP40_008626 [Aspergillus hancockii]|nr:hypothetical protein BBP40_008626 [Aspergillus hancockii]
MPQKKLPIDLAVELSRVAKTTNVKNGLAGSMRALPVIAILAGSAISKATGGDNFIEKRILGAGETILLQNPDKGASVSNRTSDGKAEGQPIEGQHQSQDKSSQGQEDDGK